MTTTIVFSDASDGSISSTSASYATARAGGTLAVSSGTEVTWGQSYSGSLYELNEAFLSFSFTAPTDRVISAEILTYTLSAANRSVSRYITWVEYDWGTSLTTADWRSDTQLNALGPHLSNVGPEAEETVGQWCYSGSDSLAARVALSSPLRVVGQSDLARIGSTPSVDQRVKFSSSDTSGTTSDPRLVFTTVPNSTLYGVLGAQVQLSDGTHAFIESDAAGTLTLKHHNNTSATSIGTLSLGSSAGTAQLSSSWSGSQAFVLIADGSNNLYVIGKQAGTDGSLCVEPWVKGAGYSWTLGTRRSAALPTYLEGSLNNFAGCWHSVGTNGTIMVLASHSAGRAPQSSSDVVYALVNCQYLLSGTGSLFRNSGSGSALTYGPIVTQYASVWNETGSQLDVVAAPGTTDRGYVLSQRGDIKLGENNETFIVRYVLASDGTSVTDVYHSHSMWSAKEAQSKVRVLGLDGTVFAGATVDSDTGWGLTVSVQQNYGTSNIFNNLAYIGMDSESLASLPPAAQLFASQCWDMVFDQNDRKLWLYYLDAANQQRLLRTSISTDTYLPNGDTVVVNASIGASTSSNYAVRVHRGVTNGQKVLVAVANKTSGGSHSTVYTVDSFNQAPNAPTLTPKVNFDASASTTFQWTFNDPNTGDTQSGFQLDINSASGTNVFDTGYLNGTISYVGVGAGASGNNTSLVPPLPSGWAEGDVFVLYATSRNTGATVNTPTGWDVLGGVGNGGVFARTARYGDVAPTVSFAGGASGDDVLAQVAAFRGLDQNTATLTNAQATQNNGVAQDIAVPALTTTLNNCVVVRYGWKQDDWTNATPPSGFTEIGDLVSASGNDAGITWAYLLQGASATVPASTFAITGGVSAISRARTAAGRPHQTPTLSQYTLPLNIIPNGMSFQWRVRTWDAAGVVGPWSDYGTFQTSAGGNVTVTDPASDNPPGVVAADYEIDWSVTGTTQNSYRVVVTRVDTSTVLVDTGYVVSAATSYLVAGMLSDVTYRVDVTVKNIAGVASGTGSRLITPSYGVPETPVMALTPFTDYGYILVTVNNPPSGSVSLGTTPYGFESGVTGFTVSGSATFTQSASSAYAGTYSGLLQVTGTATSAWARPPLADSPAIVPGNRYTVSYWANSASGYANLADAIDWYTSGGVFLSTSSQTVAVSASTWSAREFTATAPASAAFAVYGPSLLSSPPVGSKLFVDELLLTDANDKPPVVSNLVMRRRYGVDEDFVSIARIDHDGTYRDYSVASGVAYEYKVRGEA